MDDRSDNYGLPERARHASPLPHLKKEDRTFASSADVSVPGGIDIGDSNGPLGSGENGDKKPEFKSRFNQWIRVVALAIILVFVPEQASWAFNYNPSVL